MAQTEPSDDERREFPRIDVRLSVDLQAETVVHRCETVNVSWGGLALREVPTPVKVGDDVELGLSEGEPMVSAHVCWRRGPEVGVQFAPRGRQERQHVRGWVQNALRTPAAS